MPNNDFDKILSEKLAGYKAEFNPADWDKMEAMLPQDSKTPFLLIALLLLLLGVGGLWSGMKENDNKGISSVLKKDQSNKQTEIPVTTNSENKNPIAENNFNSEKEKTGREKIISETDANKEIADSESKNQESNPVSGKNQKHNSSSPNGIEKKYALPGKEINKMAAEVIPSQGEPQMEKRNNNYEERPLDNTLSASVESGEVFGLNLITSEKILDKELIPATESVNPEVKKVKNPIVEFAMGIGPEINFSFTDAQRLTNPGYSTDLNENVMFLRRIGVSLAQSYVVRKYDGGNYPCPVSGYSGCPTSYSSTVKSFDFGIDVKANIIQKSKWDLYAKAGIVNVIKMKEEFEYHYPDFDTIIPPQPNLAPQTNFNGSNTNEALFDNAMTSSGFNYVEAPDLTISGAKRYHMDWQFATGCDYRISQKVELQFEVNHSFTKPVVGAENQRLHSIGLGGRICYYFGK